MLLKLKYTTYLAYGENLQHETGHNACDAGEEVDDDEEDISNTRLLEPERHWIHDWSY